MESKKKLKLVKAFILILSFIFGFTGILLYLNNRNMKIFYILQLICLLIYYPLDIYVYKRSYNGKVQR